MKVFEILLEATTPTLRQVDGGWAWVTPDGQTYKGGWKTQADAQEWGKKNQALLQKPAAGAPATASNTKPTTPTTAPAATPGTTSTTAKPTAPGETKPFPGKYRADVRAGKKDFTSIYVKGRGFVELDANGKSTPVDKKKIIEKRGLGNKVKQHEQKLLQAFYKSKIVKLLGTKLAIFTPIIAWLEEMAYYNALFDDGFFNDQMDANGNKIKVDNITAGSHAAEARSRATQIAIQKIIIELAALVAILKTSPKLVIAIRAWLAGIPGAGWLALIGLTTVQVIIIKLLTTEAVQTWIAKMIMNDVINITGLADAIGNSWVATMDVTNVFGAYINNKKAELLGGS
jgi:hypothetical protein